MVYRTNKNNKSLVALALASLLALVLIPAQSSAGTACNGTWWVERTDLILDEPVPDFGFSTCAGADLSMADLAGKPMLINFWATWCAPCVRELPQFVEAHAEYGAEINIVGISIDQDPDQVRGFLKHEPLPYLLAWDSAGIADDLDIRMIPFTIAVDSNGRVAQVHHGYAEPADIAELIEAARRSEYQ